MANDTRTAPQGRNCTKCKVWKPFAEFNKQAGQWQGRRPHCRECQSAQTRVYSAANQEKINARAAVYRSTRREELARKSREYHEDNRELVLARMRAGSLKHEYGITPEQYAAIFDSQGGVCCLCGRPPKTKQLSVDHCHESGQIRGLLCQPCNAALGRMGDNEEGVLRALDYLRTYPERIKGALPNGPAFEPRSVRHIHFRRTARHSEPEVLT